MSQNDTWPLSNRCIVLVHREIVRTWAVLHAAELNDASYCVITTLSIIGIFRIFGAPRAILLIRRRVFRDSHLKP